MVRGQKLQNRVHRTGARIGRGQLGKAHCQRPCTGTTDDPAPHDGSGTARLKPVDPRRHERSIDSTDAHRKAKAGPRGELTLEDLWDVNIVTVSGWSMARCGPACSPLPPTSCRPRPLSHRRLQETWMWCLLLPHGGLCDWLVVSSPWCKPPPRFSGVPPMASRTGEGDGEQTVHGVDCQLEKTLQEQSEVCKLSLFGSSRRFQRREFVSNGGSFEFHRPKRESFTNACAASPGP